MLGQRGRNKNDEQLLESSSSKSRRSKSFGRIRGLLTGESRKERKARKLAEAEAEASNNIGKKSSMAGESTHNAMTASSHAPASDDGRIHGDDASTIMGVLVDENASIATGAPKRRASDYSSTLPNKSIYDSNHSGNESGAAGQKEYRLDFEKTQSQNSYILKVVLLLMDPASRRFELLQLEFDSQKARVSDVLAQIPISVTEAALREQSYIGITGVDAIDMLPNRWLSDCCVGNEVLVAMPVDSTPKECVRLARPILSDEKVVCMLQASGIDASAWKLMKKSKKARTSSLNSTVTTSLPAKEHSELNRDIDISSRNETTKLAPAPLEPISGEKSTSLDSDKQSSTNRIKKRSLVIGSVVCLLFAILVQVFHLYISTPISPGSIVAPGVWLSKCGLLGLITNCTDAFFHVSRNGNILYYNSQKKLSWQMEGATCKQTDTACIPGLQFTKEYRIILGGKNVGQVNKLLIDMPLSPWPFDVEPKLKTRIRNESFFSK